VSTHRPRGALRHYGGVLAAPRGAVAAKLALERNRRQRAARLAGAARDRLAQRRRPTRPRMRALVASPGGRLRWQSVPAPAPPGPAGAIVHPLAIATCDMDPVIALGAGPFPLPLQIGHECVAEVLSVGADVAGVRPGQRVVVPFQISCGACAACRGGHTANCTAVPPNSMYGFGLAGGHWGGAVADELAVPFADAMLVPLPESVEPVAAASVADNVCDGHRHVAPYLPALVARDPGGRVIVVGALERDSLFSASVPLYAGLVARALGARDVLLVDARPQARGRAERLGLRAVPPGERIGRAPLVVDVSTTARGLRAAMACTADDGILSSAGSLERTARLPLLRTYGRNLTLHLGRAHARTIIPAVLELMTSGALRPEEVTTTVAPIDEAPAALREHYVAGGVKTILTAAS
jgi:alcohol dehydrogenase